MRKTYGLGWRNGFRSGVSVGYRCGYPMGVKEVNAEAYRAGFEDGHEAGRTEFQKRCEPQLRELAELQEEREASATWRPTVQVKRL